VRPLQSHLPAFLEAAVSKTDSVRGRGWAVGEESYSSTALPLSSDICGPQIHYRKALSSLKHLELVTFTVNVYEANGCSLSDATKDNVIAWSGECDHCIRSVLSDEEFLIPWVALKKGEINEIQGLGERKYIHYPIPSLKRVEWYFIDSPVTTSSDAWVEDTEEDSDDVEWEGTDDLS